MKNEDINKLIKAYMADTPLNTITAEIALNDEMIGLKIFDDPLIGYASADNDYLNTLADIKEANVPLIPPTMWVDGAKSIISFFMPYTEQIRKSNACGRVPSTEWLHGRIQGQALIWDLQKYLSATLINAGYNTVAPVLDDRFKATLDGSHPQDAYGSNWSERHVAYAAGLGTFSLSKGLITDKGIAGRFGSIVTTLELEQTTPTYTGLYDNCIMCGLCVKQCPVDAISLETGKKHTPCSLWLDEIREINPPYYGCGKCQVGVPCESKNPRRRPLGE